MTDIMIVITLPWAIVSLATLVAFAVTRPRRGNLPRAWVVRR